MLSLSQPLSCCRVDTRVFMELFFGSDLLRLVNGHKVAVVRVGAVADDHLRRVLVRHDHGGLRQSRASSVRVVGNQLLLDYAAVLGCPLLEGLAHDAVLLGGLADVLERGWVLPARLLERVGNSDCFPVSLGALKDVRAGADACVAEVGVRLLVLLLGKLIGVVDVAAADRHLVVFGALRLRLFIEEPSLGFGEGGGLRSLHLLALGYNFKFKFTL